MNLILIEAGSRWQIGNRNNNNHIFMIYKISFSQTFQVLVLFIFWDTTHELLDLLLVLLDMDRQGVSDLKIQSCQVGFSC